MTSLGPVLAGSYDYRLVAFSVLIAILASYTSLHLAERVTASRRRARQAWLIGGATSMGIGIWSMHYVGMLAFHLPVVVEYDWPTVLLSLMAAIFASIVALFVVSRRKMGWLPAGAGSIFMGGGIVALHYIGMEAMRLPAMCRYSPWLVAWSVLIAVGGSLLSLSLTFAFRGGSGRRVRKFAGAALMGVAIVSMHYTAMAAASFTSSSTLPDLSHAVSVSTLAIAGMSGVPGMVLVLTLLTSLVDRLQHQRTLLDELFEQAPQAIALTSLDNRVIRVNREFARVFGYTPQETAGRRLVDLIAPDDSRDELQKCWEQAMLGERVDAEGVRRRKDGSRLHVAVVLVPFSVSGGEAGVYAIYRDITERRRAEEQLRASEARWRSIFENSAVGIAISGPDGFFTATNRAYQEMVGYTDGELQALSYLDITYEDDRSANIALATQLWERELQQFRIEKRYRRKDCKLIWVRTTVSLAPGIETAVRFGMAIVEDITERKQGEEQLRRSEAYLAESQRLSHLGSWAVNISPRELVFWSQEHYRIFGFDPEKGLPSMATVLERMHPEDRPKVDAAFESAIREKQDYDFDFRLILPDGTIKYCHSIGHPLLNEAGEVVEFAGTVMDVTESRLAEEELQRSFHQLRALAARLQNVREEERTKVAREIHDELGQALTAIKIDLASLVSDLPEDRKQQVQRGQSILRLVEETIQTVRRISTELRPGILDDLGLVAAVEWAAEEFQARTGTRCCLDLPAADIATDPELATALFRIFQETLTNVARHANANEVNVRLAQENGNLTLEVCDNGRGISEELLAASRSLGVLGMRERALLIGGELTIGGSLGQGTTVRVRIPQVDRRNAGAGA